MNYKIDQKSNFSVVIPNLNSMLTIQCTLDSVSKAARAYSSNLIEIILVDNGSGDDSPLIIKAWLKSNPDIKFKLFQESSPNSPGLARNVGIVNSASPNILFLDSDDRLHADIFSTLDAKIKSDTELIFFNYEVRQSNQIAPYKKNRNLMTYSNSKLDLLLQYVTLSTDNSVIAICFSKKLLLSGTEILFDKGIYEDIYFLAKVFLKAKKVEFLDQELYIKNETLGSITDSLTRDHIYFYMKAWKSVQSLINKNLSHSITSSHIDKSIRGVIGQMVMKIDRSNLNDTEKEEMRRHLANCIREFYPNVKKYLLSTEHTLLDKYSINFVKCYYDSYG